MQDARPANTAGESALVPQIGAGTAFGSLHALVLHGEHDAYSWPEEENTRSTITVLDGFWSSTGRKTLW